MARILANAGLIKMYFYFPVNPNDTLQRFIGEVVSLIKSPKNEAERKQHDDAPDSLSGLCAYLEKYHGLFKN